MGQQNNLAMLVFFKPLGCIAHKFTIFYISGNVGNLFYPNCPLSQIACCAADMYVYYMKRLSMF